MTDTSSVHRPRGEGTLCVPYVGSAAPTADGNRWCRRLQFYLDEPTPTAALTRAVRDFLMEHPEIASGHAAVPDERLVDLTDVILKLDDDRLKRHGLWPLADWQPDNAG